MTAPLDPLNLALKLHQPSVAARVRLLKSAPHAVQPLVVDLDPTSFCDLACPECISGSVLNEGRFQPDRLLELCQELVEAGVRAVVLIGGGEPLLHRTTPDVIRELTGQGVSVGLVTNGTHLHRLDSNTLTRLAWVRVSVDAATEATFDAFRPSRGRSAFRRVLSNIAHATSLGARVGYSYVVMRRTLPDGTVLSNVREVSAAATQAKRLGCAYLELKAQLKNDHFIDDSLGDELELLRRHVQEAQTAISCDFQVYLSSSLRALLAEAPRTQVKSYTWCPSSHLRTLLTPKGMYVCAYHRGNPAMRIGDVVETTFADAWHDAPVNRVNPSADCPFHCARHELNTACLSGEDGALFPQTSSTDNDLFI